MVLITITSTWKCSGLVPELYQCTRPAPVPEVVVQPFQFGESSSPLSLPPTSPSTKHWNSLHFYKLPPLPLPSPSIRSPLTQDIPISSPPAIRSTTFELVSLLFHLLSFHDHQRVLSWRWFLASVFFILLAKDMRTTSMHCTKTLQCSSNKNTWLIDHMQCTAFLYISYNEKDVNICWWCVSCIFCWTSINAVGKSEA